MNTKTLITLPILLTAASASAQDISAEPTFGTVELEVGFVDPHVSFESPQSGLYNIFVGSYESEDLPAAVLNISEIEPQW